MSSDRNCKGYKLTARGEVVVLVLEVAGMFVALWGGAWVVWAGLNMLVGN